MRPANADPEIEAIVIDNPGLSAKEYGIELFRSRMKRKRNDDKLECSLAANESLRRLEEGGRVFRMDGKWWPVEEA